MPGSRGLWRISVTCPAGGCGEARSQALPQALPHAQLGVRGSRWVAPTPQAEPAPCSLNEGNRVINHPQRGLWARAPSHWLPVTSSGRVAAAQLA